MKIGFFTDMYLPSLYGVETSIETFRETLENMEHEVYVYAPHTKGYTDKNSRVFRFRALTLLDKPVIQIASPFLHHGSRKKAFGTDLEICHVHTPLVIGLIGKWISYKKHVPLIYTNHSDHPHYIKAYFKDPIILPFIVRKYITWFSNRSSGVIAPSTKVKKILEGYGVKKPVYVLATGIDVASFQKSKRIEEQAKRVREKLSIPKNANVLLFVGRVGKEKNIAFLIHTLQKIREQNSKTILLIVGDGHQVKELKRLAKQLRIENAVYFAGAVPHDDIAAYYHAANIFTFSSFSETQGIVLLEAAASSLPIVALKDDAFTEVVFDGKNGFLVGDSSVGSFTTKVLHLINDKDTHKSFSKASLAIAHDLSQENQGKKLINIYKEVAEQKKKSAQQ